MKAVILLGLLFFPSLVACFCPQAKSCPSLQLGMAPRFDKKLNKWVATTLEEGPEAGYDIWGTFLRQGPGPFFNRVFKPDDYEQAVLKFMAGDKVDRNQAQAEMDAYLRNPSDWQYNRMKGYKPDYLKIDKQQVFFTLAWTAIVFAYVGRGIYCLSGGENICLS